MLRHSISILKYGAIVTVLLFALVPQPIDTFAQQSSAFYAQTVEWPGLNPAEQNKTFREHYRSQLVLEMVEQSNVSVALSAVKSRNQNQQEDEYLYLPFLENSEQASTPLPTSIPTPIPTPVPDPNALTINGTIVSTGVAVGSAIIALERYNPDIEDSVEIVDTKLLEQSPAGNTFTYNFTNVPLLESGYLYYIYYINVNSTPGLLSVWYTLDVANPPEGNLITMPTFDIADVTLRTPDDGAERSLPEDFRWNARSTETDRYVLQFIEIDGEGNTVRSVGSNDLPHPTSSLDVSSIEDVAGFQTGVEYRWRVFVIDGIGGFGYPLEVRKITFAELQSALASHLAPR